MSDRTEQVIADAFDGLDLGGYDVDELVDAAARDYMRGGTMASLRLGFELGRRGWVPTQLEHKALGLSPGVPTRDS